MLPRVLLSTVIRASNFFNCLLKSILYYFPRYYPLVMEYYMMGHKGSFYKIIHVLCSLMSTKSSTNKLFYQLTSKIKVPSENKPEGICYKYLNPWKNMLEVHSHRSEDKFTLNF